ncbi:hypothetical protein P152DRAFT_139588 [Eremomyces bilateralis CBS 781.70]|uniref:Uncharacterized protein n=1 Tax=Eremomyces bilateralis CBS 781.70 TaxID=1392243 RepID=A0A6G1FWM8_9PEZI|nr:uncharacterized protein P152DRAFT_139588 [Eremomyces bilateralis CBS 781.70]KAF1810091.1 hypothetical protein P152DRAFT_139588 [Eremomyces bilateralis CBS 781.70]
MHLHSPAAQHHVTFNSDHARLFLALLLGNHTVRRQYIAYITGVPYTLPSIHVHTGTWLHISPCGCFLFLDIRYPSEQPFPPFSSSSDTNRNDRLIPTVLLRANPSWTKPSSASSLPSYPIQSPNAAGRRACNTAQRDRFSHKVPYHTIPMA